MRVQSSMEGQNHASTSTHSLSVLFLATRAVQQHLTARSGWLDRPW
jgi:hypothetical protein